MAQYERTITIRLQQPAPLVLGVLLLLLDLLMPDRVWTILLFGLGSVLAASYLWLRRLADDIRITRSQRGTWVVAGDVLEENWSLVNAGPWPLLWAEIADRSTLPDYEVNRVVAVGANAGRTWHTRGICHRRGLFVLGPCEVRLSDPFGFFEVVQTYPAVRSLLVYPRVVHLPPLDLPRGGGAGRARARRRAFEEEMAVAGIRPYVPGDSLRRVAWRASAHGERLMVREFEREPAGDLWIALDLDQAVQVGEGAEGSEEFGVMLAASLAAEWLRRNRAVGLVAFGSQPFLLPPQRGETQLWRILESLARVRAAAGWPLARTLEAVRPALGHGITLALITPSLSTDWLPPLLWLQQRGVAPAAVLLDPASFVEDGDQPARRPATSALPALAGLLAEQGIVTHLVDRRMALRPLITHRRTRTELRALATGRVIEVQIEEEV